MDSIRVIKPFDRLSLHAEEVMQINLAEHLASNVPLRFKLLESPSWLSLHEGVLQGIAPAVEHETQLTVVVAAWNAEDLLTVRIPLQLVGAVFDSLRDPLLAFSMVPASPREPVHRTREVLTYIFGYYHTSPQGEQFFAKLREKANQFNKHLPVEITLPALLSFFDSLAPEQQQELLDFSADRELLSGLEPHLLAEAGLFHSPHLPAQHTLAEVPEHTELASSELTESIEQEPVHRAGYHLLKHLYAYLKAVRSAELTEFIRQSAFKQQLSPGGETEEDRFAEVLMEQYHGLQESLVSLEKKFPGFKEASLNDEELQQCYLNAKEESLKDLRMTVGHIVFCYNEEIDKERWEELLGHLEKAEIEYRHEHPVDRLAASYLHFCPHSS